MNEFEWRRQLRNLREPVEPERDLWARIDARLESVESEATPEPAQPARRNAIRHGWLVAASFAGLCILAGGILLHVRSLSPQPAAAPDIAATSWKPADPRLAGAAIELGSAQMELRQAMQQAPDSPALQRLLQRTEQQQSRLRQMEHQAG
jgi:hypothetical protein